MNITLPIYESEDSKEIHHVTFYKIYAISPKDNLCYIHTNGTKYLSPLSFEEVWDKLKSYEKSI